VALITGEREFWSLPFRVTPAVLIPRPDTETLVEEALALLARIGKRGARVLDVGTGSGCIAVALALERPDARVWAIDRSARALRVAAGNVARHGLARRVRLLRGDLLPGCGRRARVPGRSTSRTRPTSRRRSGSGCRPRYVTLSARRSWAEGRPGVLSRLARQAPDHSPRGWLALRSAHRRTRRTCPPPGASRIRVRKDLAAYRGRRRQPEVLRARAEKFQVMKEFEKREDRHGTAAEPEEEGDMDRS
jgi:hypothetical protein